MLISPEQEAVIGRVFESYLTEHHQGDILQLIVDTDEETHQPVVVNAMTLFEANMEVGDYFNAFPNDVLAIFDKVLQRAAVELSEKASLSHCRRERAKGQRMRRILHARITGLPVCPELTRDTIPRSRDVGHFLSVTGTVIRTSLVKVLEYDRDYMCIKCRHVFTVQADFDQFYTFVPPVTCPNPDGCNSYKFTCLSGGSEPAACRDYQEIKIQEQVQRLSVGSIPRSMVVVLEDDLVDSCKSGDDVTVYGVMCQRWKPFYDDARCEVELVLKANNIEVNNQQAAAALLMKDVQQEFEAFWENYIHDPLAGRNQILLSLCPQVFGMYVVKLAVAMVLAGGVQRIDSSGTKIRGECHMLLVGDPGTGKSQFLKYAAKIMPRSVLTAGIGSTSAGLTVAAVKDGGEWHLEAGALVLSDGGLCCIDEFNSIKEHDRISIHEAMEQQSISVAKAGIVCKLNTRSTILAATNPKGQYNPDEPLSVNVALASPLLSRFDLVLVLLDTRNAEWDRIISSFILEDRGLPADSSGLWSMEKMKAYFSLIRRLQPQLSEEANSILTRYYQLQRQSNGRNAARTTIRMLESLSRLAEAHARLMYREMVTVEDAVMAVSVMECSMQGGALLGNVNALLTSFPANPGQQYLTQCQALLEGLNLPQLLGREMDRLARLRDCTSEPPQFDPPTENYQHDLRDTNTIDDKHHRHQVSSDCKGNLTVEAGLDWFHSIALSVSPDDTSPPIITSTQGNLSREPSSAWSTASKAYKQPYRQTGKDNQSNTILASDRDGAFTSGQRSVTQEEEKQPERQKDEQHPTSVGCVVQKVSKNLRGRRLRKLELNNQLYDREGGSHQTSESLSISRLSSDTNRRSENLVQENQASGRQRRVKEEDQRDQTGAKSICTVLRKKMEAEAQTGEELQAKLSDFIFKPRKMRLSLHNLDFNAGGDVGVELQTERDPGSRDLHLHTENRVCQQMLVSHRTHAESNDAGKGSRRKKVSCSSELPDGESEDRTGSTSKHRDEDIFSLRGGTVGRIKGSNNAENVCRRQSTKVNTAGWTTAVGSPPLNSSTYVSDLAPVQSDHIKSTVASSSRAKLSRFSFTCTTKPTTVAQTVVDTSPPAALGQNGTQSLGAKSEFDTTIDSPIRSPSGTKMETVKGALRPPATALTPGQGQEQGAESKTMCKAKQTDPNRAAKRLLSNGPVGYDGAVSRIKRKCFELGTPPSGVGGSKGLFSGLSLFESVELSNDVLDTDWDREVSKKVKV